MIIVITIIKIQLLRSFHSKKRERLSDQLNPNYQSYYIDFQFIAKYLVLPSSMLLHNAARTFFPE